MTSTKPHSVRSRGFEARNRQTRRPIAGAHLLASCADALDLVVALRHERVQRLHALLLHTTAVEGVFQQRVCGAREGGAGLITDGDQ